MTALLWLLLLVPLLLSALARQRVMEQFDRYRRVANRMGVTGAEAARALLDAYGLRRVRIEPAPGALTDHYDGQARVLRLSAPVAMERSVAALGIAVHEVAHAFQDAEGSLAYRLRQAVGGPLAAMAPWSGFILIGGLWFGIPPMIFLSIAYVAGLVLFALATLPVELGASVRALRMLQASGLTDAAETGAVRRVLGAAALTYLTGLLRQIGFFCALVLVFGAPRDVVM